MQNNININIFGCEDRQFYPIFVPKGNNEKVLNLLLITEGEKKHYVLIKDFNRMMYNMRGHKWLLLEVQSHAGGWGGERCKQHYKHVFFFSTATC